MKYFWHRRCDKLKLTQSRQDRNAKPLKGQYDFSGFFVSLSSAWLKKGALKNMNIDIPTMKIAMRKFESEHGSLYVLLSDLSKRERRNLLRYGKLSKRILDENKEDKIEELLNISFELGQILNKLIKPRCLRRQ